MVFHYTRLANIPLQLVPDYTKKSTFLDEKKKLFRMKFNWNLFLRKGPIDYKSTLIQVKCLVPSHYLNWCWPDSLMPYGVAEPQYIKRMVIALKWVITMPGNKVFVTHALWEGGKNHLTNLFGSWWVLLACFFFFLTICFYETPQKFCVAQNI